MRKRIISAIMAIAMIVSVFSVITVSPVSAVAATTYASDRAALRDAIRQLYLKGPKMDVETIGFLDAVGIIDLDVEHDAAGEIVYERTEFEKIIGASQSNLFDYFVTDAAKFLKDVNADIEFLPNKADWTQVSAVSDGVNSAAEQTEIYKNLKDAVLYAASVYYFGQNEDDAVVDASFNASRNSIVKGATNVINQIIIGLKEQITGNAGKPVKYADDFMGDTYKNFLNASYKYHPALGINPFYNIGTAGNSWSRFYTDSFYSGLSTLNMAAVKWYTFDEIRANEKWLPLMSAFDLALRALQTKDGASELFYDYWKTTKPAFTGAFDALCKAIINGVFSDSVKINMEDSINTFFKLQGAVEVYEKYVKDLYNNIYTSQVDIELLTNVLTAKRFIEYVNAASVNLLALNKANLEVLLKDILDGMANVSVLSYQKISAADIASGKALVKEANALISSFGPWTDGTAVDNAWDALKAAVADLENMLPISEGSSVKALIAAEKYVMKDVYGTEFKNKAFTVEFYPNYFAYIVYKATLESKINSFYAEVAKLNTWSSNDTNGLGALAKIINDYDYLLGIVGNVAEGDGNAKVAFNANSIIYTYYLYETLFDPAYSSNANSEAAIAAIKAAFAPVAGTTTQYDWLKWAYANCYITDFDSLGENVYTDNTVAMPDWDSRFLETRSSGIFELVLGETWGFFRYGYGPRYTRQAYFAALFNASVFSSQFVQIVEGLFDKTALNDRFSVSSDYVDWEADEVVLTNAYDNAAKYLKDIISGLTADVTVKIQVLRYVLDRVNIHFGLNDNGEGEADGVDQYKAANYPNKYYAKYKDAAAALAEALDIFDTFNADGKPIFTTKTSLDIAEKNFYTAVKRLLTNLGDERFDAFLAQVNNISKIEYGSGVYNYQKLYEKLRNTVTLEEYLPEARRFNGNALIPYNYYAFTLKSVAENWDAKVNKFSFEKGLNGEGAANTERLRINFYNPLGTAINAFGDAYPDHAKDVAKEAAELKKMGRILYDAISFGTEKKIASLNKINPMASSTDFGVEGTDYLEMPGVTVVLFNNNDTTFFNTAKKVYIDNEGNEFVIVNYLGTKYAFYLDNFDADDQIIYVIENKAYALDLDLYAFSFYTDENTGNFYYIDQNAFRDFLIGNLIKPTGDYTGWVKYTIGDVIEYSETLTGRPFRELLEVAVEEGWFGLEIKGTDIYTTSGNSVNSDMPVWFAEELLAKLQAMPAKLAANHKDVIAARKNVVGGLNDLIDAAGALSVYNYYVGENEAADGLWKAFDAAYKAAVTVKYDKLIPLADIDAAALKLADAMKALESIKREAKEDDPTMEALTAKIAAAEKLAKTYDLPEYLPELDALNAKIVAAQKFVAYYGNVANVSDLADQIKALDTAMAALAELLYVYADLVADVDAIVATVNEADYTADSYAAFKAAVDAAKALGEDATVSACKKALDDVKAAKDALVKQVVIEVEPDVSAVYEEAVSIYESAAAEYAELASLEEPYSAESMAALKNAIDALKAGIDAGATDTQLIDLIVAVRLARSNLVVGNPKTLDD